MYSEMLWQRAVKDNPTAEVTQEHGTYCQVFPGRTHVGVDVDLPVHVDCDVNTPIPTVPIYPIASGDIIEAGGSPSHYLGYYVIVKHKSDIYSLYGHLAPEGRKTSGAVNLDDKLGYLCNTGTVRHHLHLEIRHFKQDVYPGPFYIDDDPSNNRWESPSGGYVYPCPASRKGSVVNVYQCGDVKSDAYFVEQWIDPTLPDDILHASAQGLAEDMSQDVDLTMAAEMAHIADVAYMERQAVKDELNDLGYTLIQVHDGTDYKGIVGPIPWNISNRKIEYFTSVVIASKRIERNGRYERIVVVAFRGTEPDSFEDWPTNVNMLLVPFPSKSGEAKVHNGFLQTANLGAIAAEPFIDSAINGNENIKFFATGHSLGGAAATLFGAWLLTEGVPAKQAHVFSYGAPPVGNSAFGADYVDAFALDRYRNHRDPVPVLPLLTHIGKELVIVEQPQIDLTVGPPRSIKVKGLGKFSTLFAKYDMKYHDRDRYVSLLERLARDHVASAEPPPKPLGDPQQDPGCDVGEIATALVIDRSGSMKKVLDNPDGTRAQKLQKAKEAAHAYVLTMRQDDLVSLSTFSEGAGTELPIVPVAQARGQITNILSRVQPTSRTNIGAGLQSAYNELEAATSVSKTALLLSDGKNNAGRWEPVVRRFKEKGWPICTIGFGNNADEKSLRSIASQTGCTYEAAATFDIVNKYQAMGAYVKRESNRLNISDLLAPKSELAYTFDVDPTATRITASSSWQGSKLSTRLVAPNGAAEAPDRYEEGPSFQTLELHNPRAGAWRIEVNWADPPPVPEQVNISVSEKSETFARLRGFRPQYSMGESVDITVEAFELVNNKRSSLKNITVTAEVQKPGPQMIRMVQAQNEDWTMYKEIKQDVSREVALMDDGAHNDARREDGVFGNSFTETDLNGAYLVTVTVTGRKQDGARVEKKLVGSFQVGSIMKNQITTSETLQYMDKARSQLSNVSPSADELLSQPLKEIEKLQSDDPIDDIETLLEE